MTYRLCLDLKTNRVIYYTQDPAYQAPNNGYVYTAEVAELPKELSLASCWQYRFINGALVYAGISNRAAQPGLSLVEGNRKALSKALCDHLTQLWLAPPQWRESSYHPIRAGKFCAVEEAFIQRIAAAQTAEDFSGLALEISVLTIG